MGPRRVSARRARGPRGTVPVRHGAGNKRRRSRRLSGGGDDARRADGGGAAGGAGASPDCRGRSPAQECRGAGGGGCGGGRRAEGAARGRTRRADCRARECSRSARGDGGGGEKAGASRCGQGDRRQGDRAGEHLTLKRTRIQERACLAVQGGFISPGSGGSAWAASPSSSPISDTTSRDRTRRGPTSRSVSSGSA